MDIVIKGRAKAITFDAPDSVLFALALRRAASALEKISRAEDGDDVGAYFDASRGADDIRDLADAIDDADFGSDDGFGSDS